jgi:undecaprenyl diphosphate synthase
MSKKITLKHIGFIMDGNGRWAESKGLSRSQGHKEGFKALKSFIKTLAEDESLEQASFYCFSTENWNRPALEVKFLMSLFKDTLDSSLKELYDSNIQINIKGDLSENSRFDKDLRLKLNEINKNKLDKPILTVNLCINYGGKDEIANAAKNLAENNQEITVESLEKEILKTDLPLDLIVRTSGEQRLSNFLLWQSAYSEFIFTNYHWPDINAAKYIEIKEEYYHRNRRFGGLL